MSRWIDTGRLVGRVNVNKSTSISSTVDARLEERLLTAAVDHLEHGRESVCEREEMWCDDIMSCSVTAQCSCHR